MSHHIRISKINDDHIIFVTADGLTQSVANLISAHLGLQVIGGHILGGIHQHSVLAGVRLLHTAIEEESHMGILLGLGDPGLGHMVGRQPFPEGIGNRYLVERHFLIGDSGIIIAEAHKGDILSGTPVKPLEIVIAESPGDLSGAVRPEIEEYHGISVLHHCHRLAVLHRHRGLYKLICLLPVVGLLDAADAAGGSQPLSPGHGIIGQLHPVVIIIPVHGIIAAHYRSDPAHADLLHLRRQVLGETFAAGRRRVPAVQKAMYIHLVKSLPLSQFQQAIKVGIVAVYAPVGQKAHEMQGAAVLSAVFHRLQKGRILKKCPVHDLLGDPGQFLVYDAARAHIQMSHLRVAHLPLRQAHSHAAGIAPRPGTFLHQFIQIGLRCLGHGVALRLFVQAVAVQNH